MNIGVLSGMKQDCCSKDSDGKEELFSHGSSHMKRKLQQAVRREV